MKKLFLLPALIVALTSFSTSDILISEDPNSISIQTPEQEKVEYYTTIKDTELRSGPGAEFNPVFSIKKGTKLKLISKDYGDFYTVRLGEKSGFIYKHDIEKMK